MISTVVIVANEGLLLPPTPPVTLCHCSQAETMDCCNAHLSSLGNIKMCLEKYLLHDAVLPQVSWYVAEFNNTVSNLAMILPALYGAIMSYRRSLETR